MHNEDGDGKIGTARGEEVRTDLIRRLDRVNTVHAVMDTRAMAEQIQRLRDILRDLIEAL